MLAFLFNYIAINKEHVISLLWRPLFVFELKSGLLLSTFFCSWELLEGGSWIQEPCQTSKSYHWLLSFLDLGKSLSPLDSFSNQEYVEKGSLAKPGKASVFLVNRPLGIKTYTWLPCNWDCVTMTQLLSSAFLYIFWKVFPYHHSGCFCKVDQTVQVHAY